MSPSLSRDAGTRVPSAIVRQWCELMERREPLVVVTVVEAAGSAPGKAGAKMLVTARASHGTVGGGRIELTAIAHARSLLASGAAGESGADAGSQKPELHRYDLVRDLGMTCGGSQTLLYEPMTPAPRLLLFGAGHVARPLCAIAALAGFEVSVFDGRDEWLQADAFPSARECACLSPSEAVIRAHVGVGDFVVLSTPSHALDSEILVPILAGPMPRYLGVIGSRRKREVLRRALAEQGIPQDRIDAVKVPVGLNLGGPSPGEIAVAVVAELVLVVRGHETAEPW